MRLSAIIFLLASLPALAASTTYRAGGKVLAIGDSTSRVTDAMGQPERVEPIENKYGKKLGEYWYYKDGNKTVVFQIGGGQVEWIEERR